VPLLITVVGGNAVTAAAVLGCLNTADATVLRRLHPVLVARVAAGPWADTATGGRDTGQWRAVLPAAVGCQLGRDPVRRDLAALRGGTALDLHRSDVTDADVAVLPPTLRRLGVTYCYLLTQAASFMHLPALESLDCTCTNVQLARLPPWLRELTYFTPQEAADFGHLRSLRLLKWSGLCDAASIASLPPSLEELDVSITKHRWSPDWSAVHLTRLRVLRASHCGIHAAALATLPPSLQVLDMQHCDHFETEGASFAHLTRLHTLNLKHVNVSNGMLTTLPPSLVSLNLEEAIEADKYAVLPNLPALRILNVNYTHIGDAAVASLPRGLEELHMVDCYHVTQRASLDHLGALRVLQSSGTDLPRATIVACRVRGCFAPADGILCKLPSTASVALIAGTRLVRCAHDGCVSLCDTSRGRDIVAPLQIRINYLHCSAIAVLADGHRVAIGMAPSYPYWGGGIVIWDTRSVAGAPQEATRLSIDCGVGVYKLVVLHNGHLLAGCEDRKLRVVDADARTVVATLGPHYASAGTGTHSERDNRMWAQTVLPDGRVASTTSDRMVWVWDVSRQVCVDKLEGHTDVVAALEVLSDGRLASGSWDKTVRLWDMRTSRSACIISLSTGDAVRALAALPSNGLACTTRDGKLTVWDTRNRVPQPPLTAMLECRNTLAPLVLLHDGRVATGTENMRLWQLPLNAA